MPYRFTIDAAQNLIREHYYGTVTIDDLCNCSREQWAHADFRPGMHVLSDMRGVDFVVTGDEMRIYASLVANGSRIGRQAVVVSTTLGRGLARMFELIVGSKDDVFDTMKIFNDAEAAQRWILGPNS